MDQALGCANHSSHNCKLCKAMSAPEHIQRFEEAMRSAAPAVVLFQLAASLRDEGVSQADLFVLFQKYQTETSGDDPRYDAIVDTMDLIWSGPWARGNALFPSELQLPE